MYVRCELALNSSHLFLIGGMRLNAFIIHDILRLNIDYMIHEDFGYYSYPEHYRFGDVMLLCSHDLTKGVLLELKGKGCRQYENFLLAQHRTD